MAKKETKKVKAKSKSKPEAKATKKAKGGKELTGLAKYQADKKAGKVTAKKGSKAKPAAKKSAKKGLPLFKAPADFKPHFLEVLVRTEKDGLLAGAIKATRFQGRYDPDAEDKKKADLGGYDPKTLRGILARLSAKTFATNPTKRLPAKTVFKLLMRINKKSADGSLATPIKTVWISEVNKKGREVFKEMDKKDPACRKIRGAARLMPAAFAEVKMPPKPVRGKKKSKDEDDED